MFEKFKELLKSGKISKEVLVMSVFIVIAIIISVIYFGFNGQNEIILEKASKEDVSTPSSTAIKAGTSNDGLEIKVYVVGAVNSPGVVTLKKGQIIDDAVKLAGGFRADADLANINLVYELKNNVMLKIRSKNDPAETQNNIPSNAGSTRTNNAAPPPGITMVSDSMGAVITSSSQSSDGKNGSLVNINTASKEKLMTIPGIGSATSDKIIKFREQNGPFAAIEDLKKVSGIGESKFNSMKDSITVN